MGVKRVAVIIFTVLIISTVSAHVPQTGEENESLENSKLVNDPTKSWVIYSEMHEAKHANYYKMELEEGERLKVSLLLSNDGKFVPNIAIMGPGIHSNDSLPDYVERPDDVGCKIIEGELGEREYEPFTPGSYYYPAEYDREVRENGTYYVTVFDEVSGGKYGLAVGYEERYGLIEWIRVPVDVINIHIWEGQPFWLIFAPMILTVGFGLGGTAFRKYRDDEGPEDGKEWTILTAAFLYLGSGAMIFMQMALAASRSNAGAGIIITILFALMPIILGYLLLKASRDFKEPNKEKRLKVLAYGLLGFVVWAGLIIGPIIAVISSIVPTIQRDLT